MAWLRPSRGAGHARLVASGFRLRSWMTHSIVSVVFVLAALHAHFAVATLPHHGGAAWRSSLGGSAAAAQTTLRLRGAGPKGKNARGGKGPGKGGAKPSAKAPAKGKGSGDMKGLADALPKVDEASIPVVTGCLESHPGSRDVKIGQFSLEIYGKPLVDDTTIELNFGRRYGLLGANGCGKSTFLRCVAQRLMPIPKHMDIFLLEQEVEPEDKTAMQVVIEAVEKEVMRLEAESERLLEEHGPEADGLQDLYDKLDELEPSTFEKRAGELLYGLGFDKVGMEKKTKNMSGGWRMRVALAQALFVRPSILVLDEPTNHLDLNSCVWLEDHLRTYEKILVITSHSQDFLNGVCSNIMVIKECKLAYWAGNYDQYVKTRTEQETNQMKMYEKQQEVIEHTKKFIASCGTYANLVKQAKSRQKMLDKMEEAGLIQPVKQDRLLKLRFPECGKLVPPVIAFSDVAFSYSGLKKDYLYKDLNIGVDSDSRIALLGPNGAGKSTLVKLMVGDLQPSEGTISRRSGLRLGRFNQHSADQLEADMTPIQYIQSKFPGMFKEQQDWRTAVGRFGITGQQQIEPISKMSEGLKSRLVFTEIALRAPHILMLDEPTNHLDMECIDSLADAINHYDGGLVLVSHDFRLIEQVAKEIWVCDKGITDWKGTIREYKDSLRKQMEDRKGLLQ